MGFDDARYSASNTYCWEAGDVFHLVEGNSTVFSKHLLDGDSPLTRGAPPAREIRFAVDHLIWMAGARTRLFGFIVTPRSASGEVDG